MASNDPSLDKVMDLYKEFLAFDKTVVPLLQGVDVVAGTLRQLTANKEATILVGSAAEGCMVPRFLTCCRNILEMDHLFRIADIPEKSSRTGVVEDEDFVGFYRVTTEAFTAALSATFSKELETSVNESPMFQGAFVSGMEVKDLINHLPADRKERQNKATRVLSKVCGDQVPFEMTHDHVLQGPSANFRMELCFGGELRLCVSVDVVGFVQLNYWPSLARAWLTRPRHWPPPDVVHQARCEGCQLVPKPPKIYTPGQSEAQPPDEYLWRMTFTLAEKLLSRHRTERQTLVYLMAKCVLYKHLAGLQVGDCEFSSYCLKTTMLWYLEETPSDQWESCTVLTHVTRLYCLLNMYLSEGIMPYYFIPEVNILREYPQELTSKAAEITKNISQDTLTFIPRTELLKPLLEMTKNFFHQAGLVIKNAIFG